MPPYRVTLDFRTTARLIVLVFPISVGKMNAYTFGEVWISKGKMKSYTFGEVWISKGKRQQQWRSRPCRASIIACRQKHFWILLNSTKFVFAWYESIRIELLQLECICYIKNYPHIKFVIYARCNKVWMNPK